MFEGAFDEEYVFGEIAPHLRQTPPIPIGNSRDFFETTPTSLRNGAGRSAVLLSAVVEGKESREPKVDISHFVDKTTSKELFKKLDRDGNGFLSRIEVEAGARLLKMTKEQASAFFDYLDVDGNGVISREELEQADNLMRQYTEHSAMYEVLLNKFEADIVIDDKFGSDNTGKQLNDIEKVARAELDAEFEALMTNAFKTFDGLAWSKSLPEKVRAARSKEKADREALSGKVGRIKARRIQLKSAVSFVDTPFSSSRTSESSAEQTLKSAVKNSSFGENTPPTSQRQSISFSGGTTFAGFTARDRDFASTPRAGMSFLNEKLTIKELFERLDANGDGELTRDEVIDGHELLNMTPAQASVFFDDLDADGSGAIDREEFEHAEKIMRKYLELSAKYTVLMKKFEADDMFDKLDLDDDGQLTRDEVVAGARLLNLTVAQASKLFDDLDVDGSGKLDRKEWARLDELVKEYDALMVTAGKAFDGHDAGAMPENVRQAREKEKKDRTKLADIVKRMKARRRKPKNLPVVFAGVETLAIVVEDGDGKPMPKAGMSFLAEKLTIEQLFQRLDENGDGKLSREEVIAGAELLNMTVEQASAFFDDLDADGSGAIDRKEFELAERLMRQYLEFSGKYIVLMKKFEADDLFDKLDLDGDGQLTRDEVIAGAELMNMTDDQASKLFDDLDIDGSGALDRNEWCRLDELIKEYDALMVTAGHTFDGQSAYLNLPEKMRKAREKEKLDRATLADIVERMKRRGRLKATARMQAAALKIQLLSRRRVARRNISILRVLVMLKINVRRKNTSKNFSLSFAAQFLDKETIAFDDDTRGRFLKTTAFVLNVAPEAVEIVNAMGSFGKNNTCVVDVVGIKSLEAALDAANSTIDPSVYAASMIWAKLGRCHVPSCVIMHPYLSSTTAVYAKTKAVPAARAMEAADQIANDADRLALALISSAREEFISARASEEDASEALAHRERDARAVASMLATENKAQANATAQEFSDLLREKLAEVGESKHEGLHSASQKRRRLARRVERAENNASGLTTLGKACHEGDLAKAIFIFKSSGKRQSAFLRRAELKLCRTPFFAACCMGHVTVAKWLYKNGAAGDLQRPSRRGTTPLAAACRQGHEEVVRWLLVVSGDGHATTANEDGVTPTHWAAEAGSVACLDLLFAAGAGRDARALDEEGFSPVRRAARSGHVACVQWLLLRGAMLGPARHRPRTPGAVPATARAEVEAEAFVDHAVYLEATDAAHGLGPRLVAWAAQAVDDLAAEALAGSAGSGGAAGKLPRHWDGGVPNTEAEFLAHYGSRSAWEAAEPAVVGPRGRNPLMAGDAPMVSADDKVAAANVERRYGGTGMAPPGARRAAVLGTKTWAEAGAGPFSPLRAFDKVAYTRAEFFAFYGDYAAWDRAERASAGVSGAGGADADDGVERRWNGSRLHTEEEFRAYFGDLVAWEAAEPAGRLHALMGYASSPLPPFAATESARPLVAGAEKTGERFLNLCAFTEHEGYISARSEYGVWGKLHAAKVKESGQN